MSRVERDPVPVIRKAAASVLRGTRIAEQAIGLFERAAPDEAPSLEMDLIKAQELLPRWRGGELVEAIPTLHDAIQAAVLDVLAEAEAADALMALEATPLGKSAAKSLQHALGTLRARGLAPRPEPKAAGLLGQADARDEERRAWLGIPDGRGQQVLVLVELGTPQGHLLHNGLLDERLGFAGLSSHSVNRKAAREIIAQYQSDPREGIAEIPFPVAVSLLLEARERAEAARERLRQPVLDLLCRLPPALLEAGRATNLDTELQPLRQAFEPDAEILAHGLTLYGLPPVREWTFPRSASLEAAPIVQEALDSRLTVSGASREDRVRRALDQVVDAILGEGRHEVLARRLDRVALVLLASGHTYPAGIAASTAAALREARAQPWRIPFVGALVMRSLRVAELLPFLVEEGVLPRNPKESPPKADAPPAASAAPAPSGLVDPSGAPISAAHSPSGLIVPGR